MNDKTPTEANATDKTSNSWLGCVFIAMGIGLFLIPVVIGIINIVTSMAG